MDLPSTFLLYATLFRLAVIGAGVLIIVLGYRLFLQGIIASADSEARAGGGGFSLTLKNVAPGTTFALFGAVLISVMVVEGSPELVMGNPGHSVDGGDEVSGPPGPAVRLRGADGVYLYSEGTEMDDRRPGGGSGMARVDESLLQAAFDLERQGKRQRALDVYRLVLALPGVYPRHAAAALNQMAWLYQDSGDVSVALPLAQHAHALAPDNPVFLDTLARAHFLNGDYREAEKRARQGLSLAPDDGDLNKTLTQILERSGGAQAGQ